MLIYKQRYKPRTTREFTKSDLTVYDSAGNTALNALTVYGKSEVVDGSIKSAGEGWATVDLGTLNWERQETQQSGIYRFKGTTLSPLCIYNDETIQGVCARYQADTLNNLYYGQADNLRLGVSNNRVYIRDDNYTDATAFKNSLNGVILAYQLADPTQGNTIAIKTDNGTGVDGTMAVFETGSPLYGIPNGAKDVAEWDGSAGEVTKKCAEINLGALNWTYDTTNQIFYAIDRGIKNATQALCSKYECITNYFTTLQNKQLTTNRITLGNADYIIVKDTDYTDAETFKSAMSGVMLIYELATPTTQPLSSTENASITGLRTFEPQTHAQNNAQTDMTVDYTIRVPTI